MNKSPRDHAIAVVKATLNLCGLGAIASLIDDYVPTSRDKSLEEALKLFGEKLNGLAERVDADFVNKDDFAELYNMFEKTARSTNRTEKLHAAANILANLFLKPDDPSSSQFDELDHLMRCVDSLSIGAIAALGAAIKLKPPRHRQGGVVSMTPKELAAKLSHPDLHLVMGLVSELRALNLMHVSEGVIASPSYENFSLQVTPMGSKFAQRFIEGQM